MDAAMWIVFMYIGPFVGVVAFIGIPLRAVQLLKGELKHQYRRLVPWGKAIVTLAAIVAVGVLAVAGGAVFSVYSHLTCDIGGGCAQGGLSVAFSLGMLGVAYVLLELLLLPFILPVARVSNAQPNP